uniref:C-type lectin domain-containing protein n=1 Tax=Periophthalmus magnuspinnatus TaxID=409849 RepID=A0A3B4A7U8_9GOBI
MRPWGTVSNALARSTNTTVKSVLLFLLVLIRPSSTVMFSDAPGSWMKPLCLSWTGQASASLLATSLENRRRMTELRVNGRQLLRFMPSSLPAFWISVVRLVLKTLGTTLQLSWIGLYRQGWGRWSNQLPLTFNNFRKQDLLLNQTSSDPVKCAVARTNDGEWRKVSCESEHAYICQGSFKVL